MPEDIRNGREFTPATLGSLTLKNRWVMLSMHTGYAEEDGSFSQRDMAFYKERAKGGVAAITLVGGVNEIGCQDRMHRLDEERYDDGIRSVCDVIHKEDCKVFMQLFHAGRNNTAQCHEGRSPLCPSAVPSPIYRTEPKVMTEEDIQQTIKDFAGAAARCKACGVDCVEVSISAGYLLSQFLSPLVNQRTDHWGGDEEKRMRFPTAVLQTIRQAVGQDYTVIVKISGGDMLGGYDVQYMIDFINQLPAGTIDGVTVTGGWHEAPVPQISYHVTPGGFSYLAEKVKEGTGLPVIACNRINSEEAAEEILNRGIVDFVGAARPFLTDPAFVGKIKGHLPYNKCQGCNRGCIERVLKYKDVRCAFNPEAGKEYLGPAPKRFERVLVVGAGPVGLTAARLLLQAGSQVTVITGEAAAGGKLEVAARPPMKQDMEVFGQYLVEEIKKLGGRIMTDTPVSRRLIEEEKPDYIYFATGAEPVELNLPGLSHVGTAMAEDVLAGDIMPQEGARVVVLGGGTVGLETAEYLATRVSNLEITVVEMAEKAGKDLGGLKWIMMKSLKKLGVKVLTGLKAVSVEPGKSEESGETGASDKACELGESGKQGEPRESGKPEACGILVAEAETQGETRHIPCDLLIFAVGSRPRGAAGLEEWLRERNIGYAVIGDGKKTGNIMKGLEDAWETIRS